MELVITIRKTVPDRDEALETYTAVKLHLETCPDLKITGHVTNHFDTPEVPP